MKRQIFYILISVILFGCDSADGKKERNADNNSAEIGKLQELINESSAGDTIDLSDISAEDTRVVINKELTIKNGTLDGISLDITAENVTLQNVSSVKKITNSYDNLTIINTNISELLLQNNQTRNVAATMTRANLIGCRVKSLTAESAINLSIANFNANIDTHKIDGNIMCPENVAAEIGINNEGRFQKLEDSDLYKYYDNNEPAGETVVYVTKEGWPQHAVDYVLSLYPGVRDVSADVKAGEKINYYFESESKARDVFTKTGWGNIRNARICMVYAPESDEENYSDYKTYLEKIKQIPETTHEFYYLNTKNDDSIVTFGEDEDGIYYETSWQDAVVDYTKAFNCSADDAKMQLFGSSDDAYIEEEFGGEGSFTAIYALDWQEADEAKWIEDVVDLKCEQKGLQREEFYRSDSFMWKNDNEVLLIYVDESWFYENEKFEKNALYYQIGFFSAVKN